MIQIEDNDLPIEAACKIIKGTRPYNPGPLMKAFAVALTGNSEAGDTVDMFDIDEIKEIADYLLAYCDAHTLGD